MTRDALREEELESRWEAAPAVALVLAMQLLLALVSRDSYRLRDRDLGGRPPAREPETA